MPENKNSFEILSNINLNDKTKEKIGLKYLSWAYAWGELKKIYPDAKRTIYKRTIKTREEIHSIISEGVTKTTVNEYENEIPYFTDGKTCTVKVGVTIGDLEYIEELPVMDNKNHAIRLEAVTSTDINKAIQRAFVKACALHGLGLYIYAGEDLPESEKVTIDYKQLKETATTKVGQITEEEFNDLRTKAIGFVQSSSGLERAVADEIYSYTTELFPNKRLSQLVFGEDSDNLQKLYWFLHDLFEAFKK